MSPLRNEHFAIPKGSTVLVTGVNGLTGSHVANEFLERGYNVHGTVRDLSKSAWIQDLLVKQYGQDKFTLFPVIDLTLPDAFEEAIKGVAAVVHVASPLDWGTSTDSLIIAAVAGATNALRASNKQPSVQRFIFTSSSVAAVLPRPEVEGIVVTEDTWNDEAVMAAHDSPSPAQWYVAYAASKTEAERTVWDFFHKDQSRRSDLVVNTVLPSTNFGKCIDPVNQGHPSTSSFIQSLWNGTDLERLKNIPPRMSMPSLFDSRANITNSLVKSTLLMYRIPRSFTLREQYSLMSRRRQNPDKAFVADFQCSRDLADVGKPRSRSVQLLDALGKSTFTSLEASIRLNSQDLA
ncbi:NAD dependent epimerase/dehydratase [Fusarium oxysporum f. sp. phaseoli]